MVENPTISLRMLTLRKFLLSYLIQWWVNPPGFHILEFFSPRWRFIFLFFLVELDSTHRDLSKNDFFKILSIFLARAKFFGSIFCQIVTFGKSAQTNRKISSIPAYSDGFQTLKKSPPVSINQFIHLLLFVDFDCPQLYARQKYN